MRSGEDKQAEYEARLADAMAAIEEAMKIGGERVEGVLEMALRHIENAKATPISEEDNGS